MKGRYLKASDIFVIVGRGSSLIYKKLKGGTFEQLLGKTSGVVKFLPLEDFEECELKERLKSCNVVKINRTRTGFFHWVGSFKTKAKGSS